MGEWGLDDVAGSTVIERLRELGQVDDRRLAVAVADSRRARCRPATDGGRPLAAGGGTDPAAAEALAALPDDERPDAERVAHRRFGPPPLRRSHGPTGGRVPGPARIRPGRRRSGRGPPEPRLTRSLPLWTALDYHPYESGLAGVVVLSPAWSGGGRPRGPRLRSARAQLSPPAEAARASARPGGRRRPGRQTDLIPAADSAART